MRAFPSTHCQICGRPIWATTGLIARHGHKQPYKGGQTRPCFGGGHRPYEEACDALPLAIATAEEELRAADPAHAKIIRGEIDFMRKRLAGWRPPRNSEENKS